jgi:hypothetical protein
VTGHTTKSSGQARAKRIEQVYDEVANLLQGPGVASRLRTSPAATEWSAIQTLGHMTEMIPHWLHHCRMLIEATGPPDVRAYPEVVGATGEGGPRCERRPRRVAASAARGSSGGGERDPTALHGRAQQARRRAPGQHLSAQDAAAAGAARRRARWAGSVGNTIKAIGGAEVIRLARTQRPEAGSRSWRLRRASADLLAWGPGGPGDGHHDDARLYQGDRRRRRPHVLLRAALPAGRWRREQPPLRHWPAEPLRGMRVG